MSIKINLCPHNTHNIDLYIKNNFKHIDLVIDNLQKIYNFSIMEKTILKSLVYFVVYINLSIKNDMFMKVNIKELSIKIYESLSSNTFLSCSIPESIIQNIREAENIDSKLIFTLSESLTQDVIFNSQLSFVLESYINENILVNEQIKLESTFNTLPLLLHFYDYSLKITNESHLDTNIQENLIVNLIEYIMVTNMQLNCNINESLVIYRKLCDFQADNNSLNYLNNLTLNEMSYLEL